VQRFFVVEFNVVFVEESVGVRILSDMKVVDCAI
jgi:hypothetical protein